MSNNVYIAGHQGMVGSAIARQLSADPSVHLITRSRAELDLLDQAAVNDFFASNNIDQVYLAAAHVGGIQANDSFPADFIYQNLMIECNVINAAYQTGVKKILLLGSSCIYPKHAQQPMSEQTLLTGVLEPTNEPYAVAKIAGIKLCESFNRQHAVDYRSVMPTNLYGKGDNFHPEHSHVIPAMIRRFHEAKLKSLEQVVVWGSGNPKREFLYVDDMADASIFVMDLPKQTYQQAVPSRLSHINVGTGHDCSIADLARLIADVVDYQGAISFDQTKPDGAPRKLLDVNLLESLGWCSSTELVDGLHRTYAWFVENDTLLREK